MPSLGLFLIWTGYTVGIWGWTKFRGGSTQTFQALTLSDLVLPSHRPNYIQDFTTGSSFIPPPDVGSLGPGLPPTDITPLKVKPPTNTTYIPGTNVGIGSSSGTS